MAKRGKEDARLAQLTKIALALPETERKSRFLIAFPCSLYRRIGTFKIDMEKKGFG
jgi:hypothetical protein